jgi:hypothetical protein
MQPYIFLHLWHPGSGLMDHLYSFKVPKDIPLETTFYGVKEIIYSAGGPLPSFERLELELKTKFIVETHYLLYHTFKDDRRLYSYPFVYDCIMSNGIPRVLSL